MNKTSSDRAQRLTSKLRENLVRRKAQARARRDAGEPAESAPDGGGVGTGAGREGEGGRDEGAGRS